uniref:hypothetical protein n=1 Tax=Nocardia neocaledoniensis TaxID=236511 RepID=UPI003CC80C5F
MRDQPRSRVVLRLDRNDPADDAPALSDVDGFAAAVGPNSEEAKASAYRKLSEITPTALLANVGSSQFSRAAGIP